MNADQEMLTRLQQELNTRFLQDRGLLPPANPAVTAATPFTVHTEMHQHQHQHLHHHQHHLLNTPNLDQVSHDTYSLRALSDMNLDRKTLFRTMLWTNERGAESSQLQYDEYNHRVREKSKPKCFCHIFYKTLSILTKYGTWYAE